MGDSKELREKRIREIVGEMSLDEKIELCYGADFWHTRSVERLGIPQVMMCDGPHGLRKQKGEGDHLGINESIETVCYPTASALAAGFDVELLKELGEALGQECQAEDVGMLLGPGLNMKRSPLCGRNFEYFSEDPYLTGKLAAAYIGSLQDQGVAACVKHFAANNQETHRMSGSSNLDERTLYETYLPAFEIAVKEGKPRSIMCAYNAINGEFCSVNKELLTNILRGKWGFEGFVVTDWGATKDMVKGMQAGLDLNMPGGYAQMLDAVKQAAREGQLEQETIDRMAERMVGFALDYQEKRKPETVADRTAYARLSKKIATQCGVLLKNEENLLPLAAETKIAFIGAFAEEPRYQGSGSSHINAKSVKGALKMAEGLSVTYAKGYEPEQEETDEELLAEAVRTARNADVAVIFAGIPDSFETEGVDRDSLEMPKNQNALIEAVAAANPNTVVVLHGGAPVLLPWEPKVKAVLCMYLGGQEVGSATLDLLYGKENPSGKLAETWPLKLSDTPAYLNFPGVEGNVNYREGVYIGYRYYDKKEMDVRYPFGHGLSYTTFQYSGLTLDRDKMTDQEQLTVTCKIKNTGNRAGKEAVQLYIRNFQPEGGRPVRELKGFEKVDLLPGEEKEICFTLDKRSFAYYETRVHDWYVESGVYGVEIGASSRDIRLTKDIHVEGTMEIPFDYTLQSPIGALQKTKKGRTLLGQIMSGMGGGMSAQPDDNLGSGSAKMMDAMMQEMPLAALASFGGVSMEQLGQMLAMLNE